MLEFNFEEEVIIKSEVAYNMETCYNNESKILYAYILLNTCVDSCQQKIYSDIIQNYLSESDFSKVVAETSLGDFNNLTFWVNKTVKDIEDCYIYLFEYEKIKSADDIIKGAFCMFLDEVYDLNTSAAKLLLDKVISTTSLEFLYTVAFYKKQNLGEIEESKETKENYFDLLKVEFRLCDIFNELQTEKDTRFIWNMKKKNIKSGFIKKIISITCKNDIIYEKEYE